MSIEEKRKSKNMTQDELAKAVGVGRSAVAMWESGQSLPRADVLKKLAILLNCTSDELLGIERREEGETA